MKPILLILVPFLFFSLNAESKSKKSKKIPRQTTQTSSPQEAPEADQTPSPPQPEEAVKDAPPKNPAPASEPVTMSKIDEEKLHLDDNRFYRTKLNINFGSHVISGTGAALLMGGQIGFAISEPLPFYVGPDVSFSLFGDGSVITPLASFWYEVRVQGAPKLTIGLGLLSGVALNSTLPKISKTNIAVFVDLSLAESIGDLASMRARFRPGIIGGFFAFLMTLDVSYRFF